jgi:UDP-N-acetylmuramoylalanine--D-glutamate ligase
MGLGSFGGAVSATRFLSDAGGVVSVTDLRSEEQLAASLSQLDGLRLKQVALGQHPLELFTNCDVLVVNPAVRPDDPFVQAAVQAGAEITSEVDLFCRFNPAPVIGVTGSNGKSTTSALIHHLLVRTRDQPNSRYWLGGNIGGSLLPQLDDISSSDIVVLELSSFQLESLRRRRFRPRIAIITNLTPNHLDWHNTMAAYHRAKHGVLDAQFRDDAAVLPDDTGGDVTWSPRGMFWRFGIGDSGEDGVFLEDDLLIARSGQRFHFDRRVSTSVVSDPITHETAARPARAAVEEVVRCRLPRQLPGDHNRRNVAAATCATWLAGGELSRVNDALQVFQGLPHRLQFVVERGGRRFFNDSIATTPESSIEALNVFQSRIVMLAGGHDKGLDLSEFAGAIARSASATVLMGQTSGLLREQILQRSNRNCRKVVCGRDFEDSFRQAVALSKPGDIVLLSPGCASYGWFRDFRERGNRFVELAMQWTDES